MTDYNIRRQKQREETENRIVEAAIKLFGENGYAKTSIKDISEEAGVAVGLVGKYYPTKEKLLTAAYKCASFYAYPLDAKEMSTRESVEVLVKHTVELYKNKLAYFQFFKTMMNASDLPEEYVEARRNFFVESTIYAHIVSEQDKGVICKGNQHEIFILFMKMIYDIFEIYIRMPHEDDNNVSNKTIQLVMNTIGKYL